MKDRLELHEKLVNILGSRNVYYQPPESIKMSYPAIVYARSNILNDFADNDVYMQGHMYRITVIDADPDSKIVEKMSTIKTAKFERHYAVNNLNHDSFTVFY